MALGRRSLLLVTDECERRLRDRAYRATALEAVPLGLVLRLIEEGISMAASACSKLELPGLPYRQHRFVLLFVSCLSPSFAEPDQRAINA